MNKKKKLPRHESVMEAEFAPLNRVHFVILQNSFKRFIEFINYIGKYTKLSKMFL